MRVSDWFTLLRIALLAFLSLCFVLKGRGALGCENFAWHRGLPMHPGVAFFAATGLAGLAATRMIFWLRQYRQRRETGQ